MATTDEIRVAWARYYEHHKKIWYDPAISIHTKTIIRIIELHRSDSQGWCISLRKFVSLLGISQNTVLKYLNEAIDSGFIEAESNGQRTRRRLKLSASLRAPVEHGIPKEPVLPEPAKQPDPTSDADSASGGEALNTQTIPKANNKESQIRKEETESLPSNENLHRIERIKKIKEQLLCLKKI